MKRDRIKEELKKGNTEVYITEGGGIEIATSEGSLVGSRQLIERIERETGKPTMKDGRTWAEVVELLTGKSKREAKGH